MRYKYPCKDCIVKGICSDMMSCERNETTIGNMVYAIKKRCCMDCGSRVGVEDLRNGRLIICTNCKTIYYKTNMDGFTKHPTKSKQDLSKHKVTTFAEFIKKNDLDEWLGG